MLVARKADASRLTAAAHYTGCRRDADGWITRRESERGNELRGGGGGGSRIENTQTEAEPGRRKRQSACKEATNRQLELERRGYTAVP